MTRPRHPRRSQSSWRSALDEWFPTFLRYAGAIALMYGIFVNNSELPAIVPAATGMVLFKTVYRSSNGERE